MGCICSLEMIKSERKPYEDIKEYLKTGDLLLFSGNGMNSFEVKLATVSPFSHVGMIVKCKHFKEENDLYIWHSPSQKLEFIHDKLTKTYKEGPQLNNLNEILEATDGSIYLRKLEQGLDKYILNFTSNKNKNIDPCDSDLIKWMRHEAPKKYETDFKELLFAAYDGPCGRNKKNIKSYFCSELVAESYQIMNILDRSLPSNEFVPADFCDQLVLKQNYKLSSFLTRIDIY